MVSPLTDPPRETNHRGGSNDFAAIRHILILQGLVVIIVSVTCLLVDKVLAWSVLLGGLVGVLPNVYLAVRLTRARVRSARQLVAGEVGKYALTIAGFVIVFAMVEPLDATGFFGMLIGVQPLAILVPLVKAARRGRAAAD